MIRQECINAAYYALFTVPLVSKGGGAHNQLVRRWLGVHLKVCRAWKGHTVMQQSCRYTLSNYATFCARVRICKLYRQGLNWM